MTEMAEPLPVTTPETGLSPFAALGGVLFRPRATFQRMREAEFGHWWLLALITVVLLILAAVASSTISFEADTETLREVYDMDGDGELSAQEQENFERGMAMSNSPLTRIVFPAVGGIVLLVIGYLVRGGVLFLVGMALGGRASFRQVFRMAVWTTLPIALRRLVNSIAIFATRQSVVSGLSAMLTATERADQRLLSSFLGGIDLYLVWSLVLIAVGMVATAQVSKAKGAVVAIVYWALTVGAAVGLVAIGTAISRSFGMG